MRPPTHAKKFAELLLVDAVDPARLCGREWFPLADLPAVLAVAVGLVAASWEPLTGLAIEGRQAQSPASMQYGANEACCQRDTSGQGATPHWPKKQREDGSAAQEIVDKTRLAVYELL